MDDVVDILPFVTTIDNKAFIYEPTTHLNLGNYTINVVAEDSAGDIISTSSTFTVVENLMSIALQPGWNLISLPNDPVESSEDEIFDDTGITIAMTVADLQTPGWSSLPCTPQAYADNAFSQNGLINVSRGTAYWVYASTSETLGISSKPTFPPGEVPPYFPLKAGWNLISVVSAADIGTPVPMVSYLASLEEPRTWARVYGYSPSTGSFYRVLPTGNLIVGKGYYVYMTRDGVLVP